jgi:O-acetyl-ADP-ribose deacetylase (regulator of RNase III)
MNEPIHGNLIDLAFKGRFEVIIHGCNCYHTMGAGIAREMWERIPGVLKADKETKYADPEKLGTYSKHVVVLPAKSIHTRGFTVVNAYTQHHFTGIAVDYNAIEEVFGRIKEDFHGKRIGYPLIGCGLAGGEWEIVSEIINSELEGEDHTLVIFDG